MKKLCAILCVLLLFCLLPSRQPIFKNVSGRHTLCYGKDGSDCGFVYANEVELEGLYRGMKNITAEVVSFSDEKVLIELLDRYEATLVFSEVIGELVTDYYYSTKISNGKNINGKRVNLQVARSKEQITVGSPLIYSSF